MMMLRRKTDPKTGKQDFARACAVEMQTDISQEQFCMEIYRKNGRRHLRGHRFVRGCAVEMHMDISQEPFFVEIYRGLAGHA